MEHVFNSVYREEYLRGYSEGLRPYFLVDENQNEAYNYGFEQGRLDYESMNGKICHGIPKLIVTKKVLEEFLLAGMLGININSDGYTPTQLEVIEKWYLSGVEKYDPESSNYLLSILAENEIEFS